MATTDNKGWLSVSKDKNLKSLFLAKFSFIYFWKYTKLSRITLPTQFMCVCVWRGICVCVRLPLFYFSFLCDLPFRWNCVCATTLPVSVFECRDPASSERGKGPGSFSQESSANHFLRLSGKKKNAGEGKETKSRIKRKEKEESLPVEWLNRPSVIWQRGLELNPNYALHS